MKNTEIKWCDVPTKGRYLAQDETGYWYLYSTKPFRISSSHKWQERPSNFTQVASSELLPNWDTLIIDLGEQCGP